MALTERELALVMRRLPAVTRQAYADGDVTDEQLEQFALRVGIKQPDFSNVVGGSDSTEEGPRNPGLATAGFSYLLDEAANVGNSLVGGGKASLGSGMYAAEEHDRPALAELLGGVYDTLNVADGGIVNSTLRRMQNPVQPSAGERGNRIAAEGEADLKRAEQFARDDSVLPEWLAVGLSDVAATPSSLASVFGGGALAGLPMGDVYAREYRAGRQAGLTHEQAQARAAGQASIEGAIEAIPLAGVAKKFGLDNTISDFLSGQATSVTKKILARGVAEGVTEMGTGVAQGTADYATSRLTDDEELREFSGRNAVEAFNSLGRQGIAGFLGGSTMSAPSAVMEDIVEAGKLASKAARENAAANRNLPKRTPAPLRDDTHGELFPDDPFRGLQDDVAPSNAVPSSDPNRVYKQIVEDLDQQIADEEISLAPLREQKAQLEQQALAENLDVDYTTLGNIQERENRLKSLKAARDRAAARVQPDIQPDMFGTTPQPSNPTFTGNEPGGGRLGGPIQTRDPDKYYDAEGSIRSRALDRTRKEASETVLADREAEEKKRVSAWQANRRKAIKSFVQEARTLDPDAATEQVATKTAEWELANPLADFQRNTRPNKPTSKTVEVHAPATPANPNPTETETVTTPLPEPQLSADELRAIHGNRPLESTAAPVEKTSTTKEQVLGHLTKKIASGNARVMSKLIADGNIVVVDDASQVPGVKEDTQGAAFADGNRTYIVANRINGDNIMGELLNLAVHEIKHAADLDSPAGTKGTLAGYIGMAANAKLVDKIEALAQRGDANAQLAVDYATAADERNPGSYNLELAAYYGQIMDGVRQGQTGIKGLSARVTSDLVAAVRAAYNSHKGVDADINLKDVGYLANKLLKKVAVDGKRLQGEHQSTPLPTVGGATATGFKDAKVKFTGKDGKERFAFSDRDAALTDSGVKKLFDSSNKEMISVSDVMEHPEFDKQYPGFLNKIRIIAHDKLAPDNALFTPIDNAINVSAKQVKDLMALKTLGRDTFEEMHQLRKLILHELQHAVQAKEKFARGGNIDEFLSENDKKLIKERDRHLSTLSQLANIDQLDTVADKLTPAGKTAIANAREGLAKGNVTQLEFSETLLNAINLSGSKMLDTVYGRSIAKALHSAKNLAPQIAKAREVAEKKYMRLYGEQEARFTERMSEYSQEALDGVIERGDEAYQDSYLSRLEEEGEDVSPIVLGQDQKAIAGSVVIQLGSKQSRPVSDMLAEVDDLYSTNPLNDREHIIGNALVELRQTPTGIELRSIRTMSAGNGAASAALKTVTDLADEHGVTLTLYPKAYGKDGLTTDQLKEWYGRNGFVEAEDGDMIRKPGAKRGTPLETTAILTATKDGDELGKKREEKKAKLEAQAMQLMRERVREIFLTGQTNVDLSKEFRNWTNEHLATAVEDPRALFPNKELRPEEVAYMSAAAKLEQERRADVKPQVVKLSPQGDENDGYPVVVLSGQPFYKLYPDAPNNVHGLFDAPDVPKSKYGKWVKHKVKEGLLRLAIKAQPEQAKVIRKIFDDVDNTPDNQVVVRPAHLRPLDFKNLNGDNVVDFPSPLETTAILSPKSEGFKSWFGNSKVVNEDGSPKVMYTGTSKDVDFKHFNVPKNGTWFTSDPKVASDYAVDNDSKTLKRSTEPNAKPWDYAEVNTKSRVFPVYLKAENPYYLSEAEFEEKLKYVDNYKKAQGVLFDRLRAQGYDAVFMDDELNTVVILGNSTQIKSVNNNGNFNPSKKDILETTAILTATKEAMTNPDNVYVRRFSQLVGAFGGAGRELGTMIEDSSGYAAKYAHRAMDRFSQLNYGIKNLAKNSGKSEAEIIKMIEDELETAGKIDDVVRRKAHLGRFVQNNPQLRPLMEAIEDINYLTSILIGQTLENNPNPTPGELAVLNKMHSNMYRYTTRMFAAFQGDAGRERNEDLAKAVERSKKGKNLNAKQRKYVQEYTNALEYLMQHDANIPEDINKLSRDRVRDLYSLWVDSKVQVREQNYRQEAQRQGYDEKGAKVFAIEAMKQELLAVRAESNYEAQVKAKADDIIKGLLGLRDASDQITDYYRGLKQDRSILQKREEVPKEIRELLGEITDPATALAITISKQAELAARTRLLLDIKAQEGKWVVKANDATLPGNERFTYDLRGDAWGPLDGYRATPEVGERLADSLEIVQTVATAIAKGYQNTGALRDMTGGKVLAAATKLGGWSKIMSVAMEGFGMTMNFAGSPLILMMNGVSPKHALLGGKVGIEAIIDTFYDGKGTTTPAFERAIRHEILDSGRVQEIRRTPQKHIRELIRGNTATGATAKYWNRGVRGVIETFAMADAYVKVAAFESRIELLKEMYAAEGIKKSDLEIEKEAASQIKDTNVTYGRTPAAIRASEALGVTTFLPYFWSVPRMVGYSVYQGYQDLQRSTELTNPEAKRIMVKAGLTRWATTAAALSLATVGLKAAAAALSDDPEKDEEMKKLLPEDARFADAIYLGKDDTGVPLFFRLSRIDPFGPITDAARVWYNSDMSDGDKLDASASMLTELLFANRGMVQMGKLALGLAPGNEIGNEFKDKESRLERTLPKTTNLMKKVFDSFGMDEGNANTIIEALDTLAPGITDAFDPRNEVPTEVRSTEHSILAGLIKLTGGRMDRADPALAAVAAGREVQDIRDKGRKQVAADIKAGTVPSLSSIMALQEEEYEAMKQAARVYEGMTNGLDLSPSKASELLKDGSLESTDVAGIRQGRVLGEADSWIRQYSRMILKSSLNQRNIENKKSSLTDEEVKEQQDRINAFLKYAEANGLNPKEK